MRLFPNVGKAPLRRFAGVRGFLKIEKLGVLDNPFLEAKEIAAGWVRLVGRRLAQQAAKVVKMLLIGGSFLALVTRPFPFEFSGGHSFVFLAPDGKLREFFPVRHGWVLPECRRFGKTDSNGIGTGKFFSAKGDSPHSW